MHEEVAEPCRVKIVAYVTSWCPDCTRSRRVLKRSGLVFAEIDIEKISGSEDAMKAVNGGSPKIPTILIDGPGGRSILVEPSDSELTEALRVCTGDSPAG